MWLCVEGNFSSILPAVLIGQVFYPTIFFCPVLMIAQEHGTTLAKKKRIFLQNKGVAGLGKIFVQRKFLAVQYMQLHMYVLVLEIIGEW